MLQEMSDLNQKRVPVSTLLLTRNSRDRLQAYFDNTAWIDDIILLDGFSTDGTTGFAEQYEQCQIHQQHRDFLDEKNAILDFGSMRNYGYTFAKHDWILCIDADEIVDDACRQSITDIVASGQPGAYFCEVGSLLSGRKIFTLRPTRQIRLFHKSAVIGCIKKVHERIEPKPGAYIGQVDGSILTNLKDYEMWKNHHYVNVELKTMRRLSLGGWLRWILWYNIKSAVYQIGLALADRLVPKNAPRMPLSVELKKLHYKALLTWRSFPLWRKTFPPDA